MLLTKKHSKNPLMLLQLLLKRKNIIILELT